jgi:hypothetical protein
LLFCCSKVRCTLSRWAPVLHIAMTSMKGLQLLGTRLGRKRGAF